MSPLEKEDISQIIETQQAVINETVKSKTEYWKQVVGVILTIVAMAVGATVWATSAHAEIVKVDAEKDAAMRKEIEVEADEKYVPKYDFAIVKEKLDSNEKQHQELIKTLDKVNEKLDKLREENRREAVYPQPRNR
jgi:vacuolar-type H+-ATPase subunit I/STV1